MVLATSTLTTTTLRWKVVTSLPTNPYLFKDCSVFHITPNPGLYSQFSIPLNQSYIPFSLSPTVTFHETLRNLFSKKFGVSLSQKKFPYHINLLGSELEVSFNAKLRVFPPKFLSLTVEVSGFSAPLEPNQLIALQKLDQLKPVSDLTSWIIGMARTFTHKRIDSPSSFSSKPAIHLHGAYSPDDFQEETAKEYVGILIRNPNYEFMGNEIPTRVFEKNKHQNLKSSRELMLLDKQGLLYVSSSGIKYRETEKRFEKTQDLYEIGLVIAEFLNNYAVLRAEEEDLADFLLYKILPWIKYPEVVFSESISNLYTWNLILDELKIVQKKESIPSTFLAAIEGKSQYFEQFPDWWNDSEIAEHISLRIKESQELNLTFLDNDELKFLIVADYSEAVRSLHAKNYKATILLCGSIAEAALAAAMDKKKPNNITTQKIYELSLSNLINLAQTNYYITDQTLLKLLDSIRDYRNTIHPGVQVRKKLPADPSKALIAIEVVRMLLRHLSETVR